MSNTLQKAWNYLFDKSEHMWNRFNEDEKIGFARLLREIALSDKLTPGSVFDGLDHIHLSYFVKAKSISLEAAASNLSNINSDEKERLISDLNDMAENDGNFSIEEKENITKIESMLR